MKLAAPGLVAGINPIGPHSPFVSCLTCVHPELWWPVLWRLALICFRETFKFYTSHVGGSGNGEDDAGTAWTCWSRTPWEQTL